MAAVEALSSAELSQAFFREPRRVKANWKAGLFQVFDPGSMSVKKIWPYEICFYQRQRGPLARCRLVGGRYGGLACLP